MIVQKAVMQQTSKFRVPGLAVSKAACPTERKPQDILQNRAGPSISTVEVYSSFFTCVHRFSCFSHKMIISGQLKAAGSPRIQALI